MQAFCPAFSECYLMHPEGVPVQLEVREQRVTQRSVPEPSRLQRASSGEVHVLPLPLSPPGSGEAQAGGRAGLQTPVAAARPAVPPINLKLKLPGQ
jgi:hypothetical protein